MTALRPFTFQDNTSMAKGGLVYGDPADANVGVAKNSNCF